MPSNTLTVAVGGLPFVVASNNNSHYGAVAPLLRYVNFDDNQYVVSEFNPGTTRTTLLKITANSTTSAVATNSVGNNFNFNLNATYITDA